MNIYKKTLIVVFALLTITTTSFICAQSKETLKLPISQNYIDRAEAKTKIMAKEINLTSEQQVLVAAAIARRDFDNSIKSRDLKSPEERAVVFRVTNFEFTTTLKNKLPNALLNKILKWEAEN